MMNWKTIQMKRLIILFIFQLLFFRFPFCEKIELERGVHERIEIFERNEGTHFKDIDILLETRGGIIENDVYGTVIRLDNSDSLETVAHITIEPILEINRNFNYKPINVEFLKILKQLNCTALRNGSGETFIKFNGFDKNYAIFRDSIPKSMSSYYTKIQKLNNNWILTNKNES
jgi:hypothetical protein